MTTTSLPRRRFFVAAIAAIPVIAVLWYLFRPELLFVNTSVAETLPTATQTSAGGAAPKTLATGSFTGIAHQTEGAATVYDIGGKKVLRLSNFKTSNGPDVRLYLVEGADGTDSGVINAGRFLDLGTLKGNLGDQNYDLPAGFDLAKYKGVSVWCRRFSVNFGGAPLTVASAS